MPNASSAIATSRFSVRGRLGHPELTPHLAIAIARREPQQVLAELAVGPLFGLEQAERCAQIATQNQAGAGRRFFGSGAPALQVSAPALFYEAQEAAAQRVDVIGLEHRGDGL